MKYNEEQSLYNLEHNDPYTSKHPVQTLPLKDDSSKTIADLIAEHARESLRSSLHDKPRWAE